METHYQLETELLKVGIMAFGAELFSVIDKKSGFEFMWDANPLVWPRHAPVLFPIVGKLANNSIEIAGKRYEMGQHGFARDQKFEVIELYKDVVRFMFEPTEATIEKYPFSYKFFITYELVDETLKITYTTLNTGTENMYFSVGAHPGFKLPEADLSKYAIVFEKKESLDRYILVDGLISDMTENIGNDIQLLPLNKELFEKDAIVLKSLNSQWLKLVQTESNYAIKLNFAGFPYMGIWTKPGQEAFLCLEPWQGIADNVGFEGDISQKEGIHSLGPGSELSFTYSLAFTC
jgi:galactose mutarotase-like enzyme